MDVSNRAEKYRKDFCPFFGSPWEVIGSPQEGFRSNGHSKNHKTVEDLAQDSAGLLQKLKGWNLISGLYEYPENKDEDLVHAYAQQARDIVVQMVRLMCERVTAALKGKAGRHENLTRKLQDLGERERNLCTLCHQALLNLKGKEAAR